MARFLAFGALAGLFILVLILAGYFWWIHSGYEPLAFSKESWAVADAELRGHMVEDLLENSDLEGMTQEGILDLLGPPDFDDTIEERHAGDSSPATPGVLETPNGKVVSDSLGYQVGYMGWRREAPMVFDYALVIRFRNGRVEAVYVQD